MINLEFNSIIDLFAAFPNEQACIKHLTELRWRGNVVSPFDPKSKVYECTPKERLVKDKKGNITEIYYEPTYRCKNTKKYFNTRTDTIYQGGRVTLQKWFLTIWYIGQNKGISSKQLQRQLDTTYVTALKMHHTINDLLGIENTGKMDGVIQIDEMYWGGKETNKAKKKRRKNMQGGKGKTPVFGMLQKGGKLILKVVDDTTAETLMDVVEDYIDYGSTIYSDGNQSYYGLKYVYEHEAVNHMREEYVRGEVHINSLEGFWSLFKRGIHGVHHSVSPQHLQKYANGAAFRYNTRHLMGGERFNLMLKIAI